MIYVSVVATENDKFVNKLICNQIEIIWDSNSYLEDKFKKEGIPVEIITYKWWYYGFKSIIKFITRKKWYELNARNTSDDEGQYRHSASFQRKRRRKSSSR